MRQMIYHIDIWCQNLHFITIFTDIINYTISKQLDSSIINYGGTTYPRFGDIMLYEMHVRYVLRSSKLINYLTVLIYLNVHSSFHKQNFSGNVTNLTMRQIRFVVSSLLVMDIAYLPQRLVKKFFLKHH